MPRLGEESRAADPGEGRRRNPTKKKAAQPVGKKKPVLEDRKELRVSLGGKKKKNCCRRRGPPHAKKGES